MQLTINFPDNFTQEKTSEIIKQIENILQNEGVVLEIQANVKNNIDAWDNLDFENIAVDTGIEDFAQNHDHYLYGVAKQ
jgi:hypothetical protein